MSTRIRLSRFIASTSTQENTYNQTNKHIVASEHACNYTTTLLLLYVRQVVRNFMSNALKFAPPQGAVSIIVYDSHVNGDESHQNLTNEEVVLLSNSATKQNVNDAYTSRDVMGSTESGPWVDAYNKKGVGDDTKHHADDDNIVVIDDREYEKYGTVIISFVDTGAGIAKV